LENPAAELKRVRVKQKELKLPEPVHFKVLVKNLRLRSGGWGPRVGDLVEFLAFGGMRIYSEALWVTWEDVDWQRKEIIVRGNPHTGTKNSEIRRVPILPDMEALLLRLKDKSSGIAAGRIMDVGKCNEALARACKEIGIPKITHHDLRHLFATRCIESGVDIPTVSRWLGHKDGGALAMKTYGHLRNEHSQAMAQKVRF
jgi:integrase